MEDWIRAAGMQERQETCPKGRVPSSVYLALRLSDQKIVGIIDFRHRLCPPVLSVWGGHIGYTVRPGERGKGYAEGDAAAESAQLPQPRPGQGTGYLQP